ncbi:heavy metal translocating P-type ATPase metal-binding domain-containing protein [Undibacterium sp. MH2W]|uniref:heavy metal translocating P-type ATPase metal-binding domain-containing protein n=1 Tax=Undibacterium sp. MH2W TaxID=3413044 RepID=UPI003BF4528C
MPNVNSGKINLLRIAPPLGASTSMAITFSQLLALSPFHAARVEKIACYHCDEKMRQTKALYVKFNGQQRAVCCHGCMAILQTIERNDMIEDYLAARSMQIDVR